MGRRQSKLTLFSLALILLAGLFLRFYGLTVGFPFEFHVDESFTVIKSLEMYLDRSFHPPEFFYPSLIYYLLLAAAYLISIFKNPSVFDLYLTGRAISALFGTAIIPVVYLTARRAYDEKTALLSAAFFAFTVVAFRESHYYTTDAINTFFIALSLYYIVRVALGDPESSYLKAGASIGLAAGSKYNGAFLLLPLVLAHALRVAEMEGTARETAASRLKALARRMLSLRLLMAAALSFVVFLATTPYALIDYRAFLKSFFKLAPALSSRIVEGNHHYLGTTPYWYYISTLLFWGMGVVLEAACLCGFLYALARRRKADLILALWFVIYFAIVGGWLNKATRYTLPMLPVLVIFGARMFVETAGHFSARGRRGLRVASVALAALTLGSAILYSLAFLNIYRQPHAGVQAVRWAFANIPANSTIMLEGPTPHERPQPDGARMVYTDETFDFAAHKFKFKFLPLNEFAGQEEDAGRLRSRLSETLDGVDYIIMSTRWYEGFVASPLASPVIKDYYRALHDGSLGFTLAQEIVVRPRLLGLEINDDSSELNFRIFDHPKIWIFRRTANAGTERQ